MIETLIEAGLRWGRAHRQQTHHINFLRRTLAVQETIVEVRGSPAVRALVATSIATMTHRSSERVVERWSTRPPAADAKTARAVIR